MVPEGWKQTVLGAHTDLLSGFPFRSADYSNNPKDVRLLRGDNIGQGKLRWRDAKYWDRSSYQDFTKYQLKVGDLIIAMDRTWITAGLKVAVVKDADIPSLLLQRVSRLRAKASLDQRLLNFLVNGHRFEQYVKSVQTETAVPHISAKQIRDFSISLPPLPEQRKIAEILSTWDRAIETAQALLATARTQKRALMQCLLTGKRRFPEFEGQEWKEVRLGDVLKQVKRPVDWSDDDLYRLISVRRRSGGLFHRENLHGRDIKTKSLSHARSGDFLISKMQVVHGGMGLVRDEFDGMQISGSYIAVNSKSPIILNIEFFDWLSRMPEMYHRVYLCSYGVHIEKMTFNFNLFLKEKIVIPPSADEQRRIVDTLACAEAEEVQLENQIEHLRTEKKALMQQLLTGKRRVVVDA